MGFDDVPNGDLSATPADPMAELETMDLAVEAAGQDEMNTMFDPDVHPRAHRAADADEPTADNGGVPVDMMVDTDAIESELGADLDLEEPRL